MFLAVCCDGKRLFDYQIRPVKKTRLFLASFPLHT
jgi:hypothetical protein